MLEEKLTRKPGDMAMKLPGNQAIWQNAWVVPNAEAAAMQWVKNFNVGPFFMAEYGDHTLTDLVYRGQPGSLNIKVACAHAGPVQIELIERLDDNPNPYSDTVPKGESRFHHIAVWTDDIDADLAHYAAQGATAAITGRVIDFVRFAYVDTQPVLACMVELVERHPDFSSMLKELENICLNWDGKDPIRDMPALG
jgi:Glyoxalase/Bleomycin resistance protein/Dioxygenase superfamily